MRWGRVAAPQLRQPVRPAHRRGSCPRPCRRGGPGPNARLRHVFAGALFRFFDTALRFFLAFFDPLLGFLLGSFYPLLSLLLALFDPFLGLLGALVDALLGFFFRLFEALLDFFLGLFDPLLRFFGSRFDPLLRFTRRRIAVATTSATRPRRPRPRLWTRQPGIPERAAPTFASGLQLTHRLLS